MANINDIEQLCYLGMRLALRRSISSPELREYAKICAERRNRNLRYWIQNEELPRVKLAGLEKVQRAHDLGRGVVVTSFQIGPYNWIPLILNSKGQLSVSLLVDAANFLKEQRRWVSREANYKGELKEPVRYINSEDPTAVWKMACSLRERRTVVGWYDGLTGVPQGETSKSTVKVNFCETSIWVRRGLAYLSAQTGAPLILAVVRNDRKDGIRVGFEDPLVRHDLETVDEFCQRASRDLVFVLEREVRGDLPCWEEWCHFHSRNVYCAHQRLCDDHDSESFLDNKWRLDTHNLDRLSMSEHDVLVSLVAGGALAMTPLVKAIHDNLSGEKTPRQVANSLADQFSYEELEHAMRALYEGHFIVKAS